MAEELKTQMYAFIRVRLMTRLNDWKNYPADKDEWVCAQVTPSGKDIPNAMMITAESASIISVETAKKIIRKNL
jgi:hypothetical protein